MTEAAPVVEETQSDAVIGKQRVGDGGGHQTATSGIDGIELPRPFALASSSVQEDAVRAKEA